MFGISFSQVLQESNITVGSAKKRYLSGGIEKLEPLLRPENQANLERLHNGLYSFLAFHPQADVAVSEYVEKGSLASDSGTQIMVLFIAAHEMRTLQRIKYDDLIIQLDDNIHPAYEAINILFPGKNVVLPGIVFFDSFIQPKESVYLPLSEANSLDAVKSQCQLIFSTAKAAYATSEQKEIDFTDHFCVQLGKNQIKYQRTGKTSMGEWLVKVYNTIKDNKSDIIQAIALLG